MIASATTTHAEIKEIQPGFILPSAAFTIQRKQIKRRALIEHTPQVGDLIVGKIHRIGEHFNLENKEGRLHLVNDGTRAVFVLGNRYAPDYFEGHVPETLPGELDLLARSGLVGRVINKNNARKDPTRIKVLGYVVNEQQEIINTRNFPLVKPRQSDKKQRRAKMILVVGTSMNSGKSMTGVAACWALAAMGYTVRASKITGTASLKDILHMEDAGAAPTTDFTYLGYPSTYMLPEAELLHIFNSLDLKYANNPRNFWVVEVADGILQRENAILLNAPAVRERIHRLLFAAPDALGAIGGIKVLREEYGLTPDAISGVCSSSPLMVRELEEYSRIPVFNNIKPDLRQMSELLL